MLFIRPGPSRSSSAKISPTSTTRAGYSPGPGNSAKSGRWKVWQPAVVADPEKAKMPDPSKRTRNGTGSIYQTTLPAKSPRTYDDHMASLDPLASWGLKWKRIKRAGAMRSTVFRVARLIGESKPLSCAAGRALGTLSGDPGPAGEIFRRRGSRGVSLTAVREVLRRLSTARRRFFQTWDTLSALEGTWFRENRGSASRVRKKVSRGEVESFWPGAASRPCSTLAISRAEAASGLVSTYLSMRITEFEVLLFECLRRAPIGCPNRCPSAHFEGPVRIISETTFHRGGAFIEWSRPLISDKKLKMFKLNVPES